MIRICSIYNCDNSKCRRNDSIPLVTDDYSVKYFRYRYTNSDSLLNKLEELKCRISESNPDIVCITEIFPKHCVVEVSVANLQISGYNCYCSNFSHSDHGICLYVKDNLIVSELRDLGTINFQESLWYSVSSPDLMLLLVLCIIPQIVMLKTVEN